MLRLIPALVLFFASGCAALLYQVIWQRLLVFFSGADVHSATIVVAAFMAGLGIGSLAGGWVADRVSRAASLALFATAEVAIGVFGFFSSGLFYDVLYQRLGHLDHALAPTAVILFVALLWPTFFMGVSLPLLARGLTTHVGGAASTIGWLYAMNTAGAAAGAIVATWVLMPQAGLVRSLRVAAMVNLLCAMAAIPLAIAQRRRFAGSDDDRSGALDTPDPRPAENTGRMIPWAALFAVSGFLALSLEIVWFRLLGVMLKSTSFTFGTLLAVYLLGLGLGGAAGSVIASRVRQPDRWFLALQAGAGAYAAISLTLFVAGLEPSDTFAWFAAYFGQYDGVDIRATIAWLRGLVPDAGYAPRDFARLYILLPAVLVGPPTIMAGLSFPLLQRVVQSDLARVGGRVGVLMGANIAGSTLGAFVTGLVLLDLLGTAGTLKLLYLMSAAFGVLALRRVRFRSRATGLAAYGAAALMAGAVFAAMPKGPLLWARLHGTTPDRIIQGEDGSGLSLLKAERVGVAPRTVVFVNGLGQSWIPYGDIHTVLGALPAFVHPNPKSAALIGLGSGDTLYALAGRRALERIVSIEIIRPQLESLREFGRRQKYPAMTTVLGDRRIEHVFGDGRLYLRRAAERFDIIEADALRPNSAYAGNLYSDAYFELLRDRLNPGGLAVTWAPTPRIVRTFLKVFPHVWVHRQIVIGSDAPIRIDRAAIAERLNVPAVSNHFAWSGVDIHGLLRPYTTGGWRLYDPSHDRSGLGDINSDLDPRDEFDIPPLVDLPIIGSKATK